MSFTSPTAGPPSLQHSIQGPEGLPGLATSLLWVVPGGAPLPDGKGSKQRLLPAEQRRCHQDPPLRAGLPPTSQRPKAPPWGSSRGAGQCCAGSW